jgi:hypothetical protein
MGEVHWKLFIIVIGVLVIQPQPETTSTASSTSTSTTRRRNYAAKSIPFAKTWDTIGWMFSQFCQ